VEKQKEKLLEEEAVLKQLKKIQVDISIWGLLMYDTPVLYYAKLVLNLFMVMCLAGFCVPLCDNM